MKINGVDISKYGAKQWTISPGKRRVSNVSETLEGAVIPVMSAPVFGLKEYTLEINIHGQTREDMWDRVSSILALFSGVAEVEMEIDRGKASRRYFKLSLSAVEHEEYGVAKRGCHILKLSCVGYEYGKEERYCMLASILSEKETVVLSQIYPVEEANRERIAVVAVNVRIEQGFNIRQSAGDIMAESSDQNGGKLTSQSIAPISAEIEIHGLCRNRAGKDFGPVYIRTSPNEDKQSEMCAGINTITINGITGMVECETNTGEYEKDDFECKVSAPMFFGFSGQQIRCKVTTWRSNYCSVFFAQKLYIYFVYTPIYL